MADEKAYVCRVNPGEDMVEEALQDRVLYVGWGQLQGLLDEELGWHDVRERVKKRYFPKADGYHAAGNVTGSLWKFAREMKEGDLVLVPHGSEFYITRVTGEASRHEDAVDEDKAFRRPIELLNDGAPVPRTQASAALQSRLKSRQTCVEATSLLPDIRTLLRELEEGLEGNFSEDLRQRLRQAALEEIRSGRMNEAHFEDLVVSLLRSVGGTNVRKVARSLDEGADVLGDFTVATTFPLRLAVQAKFFKPDPPVKAEVLNQLVRGMDAEDADLGWVVTSGTFSPEAEARQAELADEGYDIELVDGELLASMIVESDLHRDLDL